MPAYLVRPIAVASVALLLSGCSAAASPPSQAQPAPVVAAAVPLTPKPALTELDCIDRTGSLPPWFTQRALGRVADEVEKAVNGPMAAARFYVRSTSSASYSPDAEITTVTLAAVPPPPQAPVPSTNPYLRAQNNQQEAAYRDQLATWTRSLDTARGAAREQAGTLRALTLPVDTTGTDVLGCPLRATDLLDVAGERRLFIASDLVATGPQQDIGLPAGSLAGVTVSIAFYCRDQAGACATRIAGFRDRLRQAGATDIAVIDPQNMGQ